MDYREKSNRIAAGYSVHFDRWANRRLRGRTEKQVRDLLSQAAKSATVCANCFRPLSPTDSVTIHWRKLGGRESPLRRVPVCLICTLDRTPFWPSDHQDHEMSWQRMRCHGCGRPMRVDASVKFGTPRTCCDDCARAPRNIGKTICADASSTNLLCASKAASPSCLHAVTRRHAVTDAGKTRHQCIRKPLRKRRLRRHHVLAE